MTKMTIIAALDFTDMAEDVARLGAALARRFGDKLLLLHAVEPAVPATGGLMPIADDIGPELDAAEAWLGGTRRDLVAGGRAGDGIEIEARATIGPAAQIIVEAARESGARLLVMGTHGRGAAERLLLGSVAQSVLLHAPCAMLVVRPGGGTAVLDRWLAGKGPLRAVVGVDRKGEATDAAIEWARRIGDLGACELTFVHEFWPPAEYERLGMRGPRDVFETDAEVATILERELATKVGSLAAASNVRVRARGAWGPLGEALAREAAAASADLVIVGTEQPHGWARVTRGSAAISALHAVPLPMLCVPARARVVHPASAAIAPPLRSVLVATDLSAPGNAAVAHAYALLGRDGGTVHLLHVCERFLPSPPYVFPASDGALTPAHRAAIEAQLHALIPAEAAALGITTHVLVVDGGDAGGEVLAAALRLGVGAIVLASHGRSRPRHPLLGSVAEAVARKAEVPVYLVRGPADVR